MSETNEELNLGCVIVPFSDRFIHKKTSISYKIKAFIYKSLRKSLPTILINNSNWYLGDTFITYPSGKRLYLLYIEEVNEKGTNSSLII